MAKAKQGSGKARRRTRTAKTKARGKKPTKAKRKSELAEEEKSEPASPYVGQLGRFLKVLKDSSADAAEGTWSTLADRLELKTRDLLGYHSPKKPRRTADVEHARLAEDYAKRRIDELGKSNPKQAELIRDALNEWRGVSPSRPSDPRTVFAHLAHTFGRATDIGSQETFSSECAGAYVLLRPNREGRLISALLVIDKATAASGIPLFSTQRVDTGDSIRDVQGLIYSDGGYIFAVGHVLGTRQLRFTILRRLNIRGYPRDMIGIRLGISETDGPFAKRIYCRGISPDIYEDLKSRQICGEHDRLADAKRDLGAVIPDLDKICDLLVSKKANAFGFAEKDHPVAANAIM